jgi:3-oxoadipate enol-lactonase
MPVVRHHGVDIAFDVLGTGPPIVLGHSFLCSGAMWREQVPALAAEYRVINIDYRGHGASGGVEHAITLYDLVGDVTAVLDHVGVRRAVWAGLSIGGMVALRAALRAPERVAGLILVDTDAGPERLRSRIRFAALGVVARVIGIRPLLPQVLRQMFGVATRQETPELVTEWADRFTRVHVPSAVRTLRALRRRDDLTPHLSEIRIPTLVLVGEEDASLPPPRSRHLASRLPQASLIEIGGAGHLSALERPDAVTRAMLDFLRPLVEGSDWRPTTG